MSIALGQLIRVPQCALAVLAILLAGEVVAQAPAQTLPAPVERPPAVAGPPLAPLWSEITLSADFSEPLPEMAPPEVPLPVETSPLLDDPSSALNLPGEVITLGPDESLYLAAPNDFTWQVAPSGLIYRSYLAGPLEPRTGITPFFSDNHTFWDASVGGRGGVLRYGDCDPLHPQGWQLDVYGAAITRLDAEFDQDLVSADFVFGFPITYGVGNWQFKTGYAHLSSHLGDEYAMRYPDALDDRINYVRDSIVFGASWYPVPACRVYGELDWAVINVSGGAEPIAFQFGTELSRPGPTGLSGSPFLAINGRSRQEIDFGGDVNAETGWLWRGVTGKVFRLGVHYYTGHSSQSQFYKNSEEQIGIGLWYDF